MKTLLVLSAKQSSRTSHLYALLENSYLFREVDRVSEAVSLLEGSNDNYYALFVDNPSSVPDIGELTAFLKERDALTNPTPCLILSDDEHKRADEEFLTEGFIAIVLDGESKKVVGCSIERSVASLNSLSFQGFSSMLKELPSLIYLKDAKGRYVFCSQYWNHLDRPNDPDWSIRGKTDLDVRKNKENAKMAMESDMKVISSGKGTSYVIKEMDANGDDLYLQLIKEPVKDEKGRVTGIIAIVNNVTEQEKLRMSLRHQSITDAMTGVYNRTYFNEFLELLSDKIRPITVITADCDGLKEINDQHGHAFGDKYIRATANILKENTPESGIKIRMGGDEFIVILPGASEDQGKEIIHNLFAAADNQFVEDVPLEISFGVATASDYEKPFRRCLIESDEAMYRSKRKRKRKRGTGEAR